ncbi:MAG: histidine phosphatase family protein [Actinomycetota bacterium]|jgi:2,3-bisphosphoglycerate-dependent phosphoglycerate mutase|nr:histidine phosphatase family protein [Actinomycetota bacterium]
MSDDAPELVARLLLVRHGESQVMVDGVVGGPETCSGLSDLGRAQAAALRERFANGTEAPIDVVYSSPLPRARETTDIVLPALGGGGLTVNTHPELEEFRLGEADGLTWDQVRERYGFGQMSEQDPYRQFIPGGDTRAGFRHRVAMALADIAEAHHGQTVFVGCHGGVISSAMAVAFSLAPNQQAVELPTVVTSITELEILRGGGRGRRWVCRRYNDSTHLHGTELDPRDESP